MKAALCVQTLENTVKADPDIRGSGHPQWQREPVYQPDLPGCGLQIWHKTKHEQRRREMP